MKKAAKKAKKKPKKLGSHSGKLMTKEQKELHRELIGAEMLLANAEHNYKVAHGYIGDFFSKTYVEKKYGKELTRAQGRVARLQRKRDAVIAKIIAQQADDEKRKRK